MKALTRFRAVALALGVVLAVGCSTDEASSPTQPPPNPVPPPVGINVSVTASNPSLEVDSTAPSIITIRATRADNGQPVPNLTQATVTTTLGGFGSVGGPQSTTVELINGEAQVPLFAGATIGTATVRASVPGGVGITSVNVRERGTGGAFFIGSVSPGTGSPQGGDTVVISGNGFSDPIRVTFGGRQASIQFATETQITVTTPPCSFSGTDACFAAGASTPTDVSVIVNLNTPEQAQDTLSGGFVYQAGGGGGTLQPVIFSVTPASGPDEGGTQVTINGDGFEAPVQVRFGTGTLFAEAQVLSVTRSRIVVRTPPFSEIGPPGTVPNLVNITVINQNSGRTGLATNAFRYGVFMQITAISPGEGPPTGGTTVTIFGQGFDEPVAVTMANRGQQVISVSGSEIVVRTVAIALAGCANVEGPTTVTNIESGDSATGPTFSYIVPRPQIFGISPISGPQSGNTLVTISGQNFSSNAVVKFLVGGSTFTGSVQSTNPSSITVRSPAVPNSVFGTEVCDDNGDPPQTDPPTPDPDGERYLATQASIEVTDVASGCTVTLEGAFTYNPTDTSCRGD